MHAVPPYYMHGAAPKMQSYPGADGVHDHADDHADPTDDGVLLMVQFVLTDAKTVSRVTAGLSRAAQEFVEEVYELRRTGCATTEELAAAQKKLFASNFQRVFRRSTRGGARWGKRCFTQAQRLGWLEAVDKAAAKGEKFPRRAAIVARGFKVGTAGHRAFQKLLAMWLKPDIEAGIRSDGAAVHTNGRADLKRRNSNTSSFGWR